MTDREFRDAVYKKYNAYRITNEKSFVKQYFPKHVRPALIITIIIFSTIILGISAAAATYYYQNVWKEPEEYSYEIEKNITKEHYEKSISEKDAKQKSIKYILNLVGVKDEIVSCELTNDPTVDKTFWNTASKGGYNLVLNGNNGNLVSFIASNSNTEYPDASYNEAKNIGESIIERIGYSNKGYELEYITNSGNGIYQADFCKKYNGVVNAYQCVRIRFSPKSNELLLLRLFDEDFENNPYNITKDQAIELVKNNVGQNNIEEIYAKKAIEKMNALLYQQEHSGTYRTEQIVRNIWLVTLKTSNTQQEKIYYVDATTGEFIGGDMIK